jgi:hypothetical protein
MTGRRRRRDKAAAQPPRKRAPDAGGAAPAHSAFPVVGLGASAGGLDAFQKFFDALAPDSGMAFILIQHLDPTHQSMMVDLLAGHTPMTVQQAQDGMPLEREHIYIIPPGSYLSIGGGALRLSRPRERHGARMPFDFFLRSLAEEVGERSGGHGAPDWPARLNRGAPADGRGCRRTLVRLDELTPLLASGPCGAGVAPRRVWLLVAVKDRIRMDPQAHELRHVRVNRSRVARVRERTSRLVLGLTLTLAHFLRVLDALRLGQPQYALVVPGNRAITFARGFLELGPVEYRETTPRIADDAVVLERPRNPDQRRPVHPQHLREIFLRERKVVAGNAVLRRQQPSCKTLRHGVNRITNYGLKNLREQRVCVPGEEIAHDQRAVLGDLDPSRLNPKRRTCDLGHRPGECGLVARADDPTDGAFPPDGSAFGRPAVFEHHDQRRHRSRQRKVGNDDILFRFEENLTLRELDKLGVGFEHSAIDCRNCGEETIFRPMAPDILVNHTIPPNSCFIRCVVDCHRCTEMSVVSAT